MKWGGWAYNSKTLISPLEIIMLSHWTSRCKSAIIPVIHTALFLFCTVFQVFLSNLCNSDAHSTSTILTAKFPYRSSKEAYTPPYNPNSVVVSFTPFLIFFVLLVSTGIFIFPLVSVPVLSSETVISFFNSPFTFQIFLACRKEKQNWRSFSCSKASLWLMLLYTSLPSNPSR